MDEMYIKNRAAQIVRELAAARRAERAKALNAFCPACNGEVLDELLNAAHEGFEMPDTVTIACPHCDAEVTFALEWTVEIVSAEQVRDL